MENFEDLGHWQEQTQKYYMSEISKENPRFPAVSYSYRIYEGCEHYPYVDRDSMKPGPNYRGNVRLWNNIKINEYSYALRD